ncbi:MAG: UDP-N-acetylmuramoyl-tripeptide--D-alanyl-D-alanine ligase [Elusimicrobiota bacterium]|nr:UDP-N-acetylmuramoyl-tripeptide--D-alanyl-D-alanine ligase [Elusimicrobiota bacterium]
MESISLNKIAELTGGKLTADGSSMVDNAVIDSRLAGKGSLFFCFKGAKTDGHNYCGRARSRGGYCLGEKESCDIVVDSTGKALARLAKEYIKDKKCRVIAVTGSAGKTTAVRIIAGILGRVKETVYSPKNFNNRIGLPLSLLKVKDSTEYLVLEMGANHRGEIKQLAEIADPDIGVLTNVGTAHIGYFKSRQNILDSKMELADYIVRKGGTLFYNYDSLDLRKCCAEIKNSIGFGFSAGSRLRAEIISKNQKGSEFKVDSTRYILNIPGKFNISNALAALAVAGYEKIDKKVIIKSLREIELPGHRMEKISAGKYEIIDDTYNANPDAARALFKDISGIYPKKKIIAVVGQMLELGSFSVRLHYETGKFIGSLENIKYFLSGGDYKKDLAEGAESGGLSPQRVKQFNKNSEAVRLIEEIYSPDSLIVLKASRLQKFEEIIEQLAEK